MLLFPNRHLRKGGRRDRRDAKDILEPTIFRLNRGRGRVIVAELTTIIVLIIVAAIARLTIIVWLITVGGVAIIIQLVIAGDIGLDLLTHDV